MRGISNYAEFADDGTVTRSDSDHNTQNGQNTSPARKPAQPEEAQGAEDAMQQLQQMTEQTAAPQPQPEADALPDWAVAQ